MVDREVHYQPVNISHHVNLFPPTPPTPPIAIRLPPVDANEERDLREEGRAEDLTRLIRKKRVGLEEQAIMQAQLTADEARERARLLLEKQQSEKRWLVTALVMAIIICCLLALIIYPTLKGTDDTSPNGTHVHTVISYERELFRDEGCVATIIWRGQKSSLASARPFSRKLDDNLATLSQALNVTKTESRTAVRSLNEELPGFDTSLGPRRCLFEVQSALATRSALSWFFNGFIPPRTGPLGENLASIIAICQSELPKYQARLRRHYTAFTDLIERNAQTYDIYLLTSNEIRAVKQQHPTEDLSAWFSCSNTTKPSVQEVLPEHELLKTGAPTALQAIAHFLFSYQSHVGQAIGMVQSLPPPALECRLWQDISCQQIWKTLSALEDQLVLVGGELGLFRAIWIEQREAVLREAREVECR